MYVPKWLIVLTIVAILAFVIVLPVVSQPQRVSVPVGIIFRDGENHPIRGKEGLVVYVFRVGNRTLPRNQWIKIKGRPDEEGYLRTATDVSVDNHLTPLVNKLLE